MRKNKTQNTYYIQIMISVIIILLATVEVHALGISPSKKIIDYDTEEHIITSSIINNEARDIAIKISASGSLSKYVIISEPVLMIRSDESEKEFTYIVQLPENVSKKAMKTRHSWARIPSGDYYH